MMYCSSSNKVQLAIFWIVYYISLNLSICYFPPFSKCCTKSYNSENWVKIYRLGSVPWKSMHKEKCTKCIHSQKCMQSVFLNFCSFFKKWDGINLLYRKWWNWISQWNLLIPVEIILQNGGNSGRNEWSRTAFGKGPKVK